MISGIWICRHHRFLSTLERAGKKYDVVVQMSKLGNTFVTGSCDR